MTRLRVSSKATESNRYVYRVSVNLDLDAQTVRDPNARRVWHGGTAMTRVGEDDTGQVARNSGGTAVRSRQTVLRCPSPATMYPRPSKRTQTPA